MALPEDDVGQRRALERKHVLIVGVGGLGCPVLWQLAAAGVGQITVMDPDVVELSNLNRQVLYRSDEIGLPKARCAAARVHATFPQTHIDARVEPLTAENVTAMFTPAHFIVDATDGVAVKFLINDGAVEIGRAFSHAGILGLQGQTMTVVPGQSACLRCLFPEPPAADAVPTCQEAGILGAVAGVIGSVQAHEAIKYLLGDYLRGGHLREDLALLTNRLLTFDGLTGRSRSIALAASPQCPLPRCRAHAGALDQATAAARGER